MTEAHATTEDGRDVLITQPDGSGPLVYHVADDRFTDGWRPVDQPDDVAELVGSINRAQTTRAEAEVLGTADQLREAAGQAAADEDPPPDDEDEPA